MKQPDKNKIKVNVKALLASSLLCLITITHFACSQAKISNKHSFDRGILWSIQNPKSNKVSYLLGTIHMMDTNLIKLPLHQLQELVLKTDILCLESVPPISDKKDSKEDLANRAIDAFYLKDTTQNIMNGLDKKSKEQLTKLLQSLGGKPKSIQAMLPRADPSTLALILTMEKQKRSPFFKKHNFSPEGHFIRLANENNMQIKGLEKYGGVLTSLKTNEQNFSDNIALLREAIDAFDKDTIDIFKTYLRQDKNYVPKSVTEDSSFIQRHNTMVSTIDSLIQNNTLFIMIGAAHLAHERGVLNQLHKKGYIINNMPLEISHSADLEN